MTTLKKTKEFFTVHNYATRKAFEKVQFDEIPFYLKNVNKVFEQIQDKHPVFQILILLKNSK